MHVQDIMTREPVYVREKDFMTHIRQVMRDHHYRTLPVVDEKKRVKGILTDKDLLNITSTRSNITVEGYASLCPTVTPETDMLKAAELMIQAEASRVPVVKSVHDSTLVGILSIVDIFRNLDIEKVPDRKVGEIMTRNVVTCSYKDRVAKVWRNMRELGYSGIPVVRGGTLIGMVTRRNIIRAGYARIELEDAHGTRAITSPIIQKIMSTPPYTITENTSIKDAIRMFLKLDVGRISVVKDRGLIGIVDRYDLVKACFT